MASWELRILGNVEAYRDGRSVDLGHARQKCVLVALLIDVNRPLTVDQLLDRVWECPPPRARKGLHSYLSRLRATLCDGVAIRRAADGYILVADPETIDLQRFRRLTERAWQAGDEQALELLNEALGLWRGQPLSGLSSRWLDELGQRLEAERLDAWHRRNDVALRLGRHARLLSELVARSAADPLDERLAGQLMLALHREGQTAQGLEVYRRTLRRLAEDLGIDPGPRLQEIHLHMLGAGSPKQPQGEPGPVRVAQLPPDLADFTGRDRELAELAGLGAGGGGVICIDGMAGVGKTALAVHAARLLAPSYPDGQIFLDLQGFSPHATAMPPHQALAVMLGAVGVPRKNLPASADERAALWRSLTSARRLLVVLDNALDARQMLPLLPPGACLTLVTSRHRLAGPDGAAMLSLDVLDADDALNMFARIIGRSRAAAEPQAGREVIEQCGRLPLAIRLAATRLRHRRSWRVADLAQRLSADREPLRELRLGERSVHAAFTTSYRQLAGADQRLFRVLGRIPGADFDAFVVAAVIGGDPVRTARVLENLVDAHLLQTSRPGRFHLHDLLRGYAQEIYASEVDGDGDHAGLLVADYYLQVCRHAVGIVDPWAHKPFPAVRSGQFALPPMTTPAEAFAWLDVERPNLPAVVGRALADGHLRHAWQLAYCLWRYYWNRGYGDDWIATGRDALTAALRLGDPEAEALIRDSFGLALWTAGDNTEAKTQYEQALRLYTEIGDRRGEGRVLRGLGSVSRRFGDYDLALRHLDRSLAVLSRIGDDWELMHTHNSRAIALYRRGDLAAAADSFQRALSLARSVGDHRNESAYLSNVGGMRFEMGDYESAVTHLKEAIDLDQAHDHQRNALTYNNLAVALHSLGQVEAALHHHHQAIENALRHGNRTAEAIARHDLGKTLDAMGQQEQALRQHQAALALARQTADKFLQSSTSEHIVRITQSRPPGP